MKLDRRTQLFVTLAALFVSSLLLGDIIGGKLYEHRMFGTSFVISLGIIPFPITFLLTDILNEFYGKSAARFITWVGFAMALFAFLILGVALQVPWAEFTRAQDWTGMTESSFNNVFGGSRRILVASMCAYVLGQFADIAIFNFLKRLSQNRLLWLRATGSTVVSQLLDTVMIQAIAWWGILPAAKILTLVGASYVVKLVVAIGLTPLVYAGHAIVQRLLKIEPVRLNDEGEPVPGETLPNPSVLARD